MGLLKRFAQRDIILALARWPFAVLYAGIGLRWFYLLSTGSYSTLPANPKNLPAVAINSALSATGYIEPMIATTCLVSGLLLLFKRTAPLALIIVAPLVINMFFYNLTYTGDWIHASTHLLYPAVLAWFYRSAYRPLWSQGRAEA